MTASLSLSQARRIALAAQGLDKGRPAGPVTSRAVGRTFARIQLVQIDSVNVLQRAHYMPLFSRMGCYDTALLDRASGRPPISRKSAFRSCSTGRASAPICTTICNCA